jgi:hypothetical protein
VTTDALNCQRAIAGQIVDQGGDYALALKGIRKRCIATSRCFSTISAAACAYGLGFLPFDEAHYDFAVVETHMAAPPWRPLSKPSPRRRLEQFGFAPA